MTKKNLIPWTLILIFILLSISSICHAQELTRVEANDILVQIENGEDVVIENAIIGGNLNLNEIGIVEGVIKIENSMFENNINFSDTEFRNTLSFERTVFLNKTTFERATFYEDVNFKEVIFNTYYSFSSAEFKGNADFTGASFNFSSIFDNEILNRYYGGPSLLPSYGDTYGNICFMKSKFNHDAIFQKAVFNSDVTFIAAEFNGPIDFQATVFNGGAYFQLAKFNNRVSFFDAIFNSFSNFNNAIFNVSANFSETSFNGEVSFYGAFFDCPVNFQKSDLNEIATFDEAIFNGYAAFQMTIFRNIVSFHNTHFYSDANFAKTIFNDYTNFDNAIFYDNANFTQTIFINDKMVELRWNSIEHVLVFDGPAYVSFIQIFRVNEQFPDADAAYFQYRRINQKNKSFLNPSKYTDTFMCATCGYGVKPERALIIGVCVILFLSPVYWKSGLYRPKKELLSNDYRPSYSYWKNGTYVHERKSLEEKASLKDALCFSMGTFVTVGYGEWMPREVWYQRLVIIEGLVGWFLMTLFVVTLTNVMIRP